MNDAPLEFSKVGPARHSVIVPLTSRYGPGGHIDEDQETTAIFAKWASKASTDPMRKAILTLLDQFVESFGAVCEKLKFEGCEIWIEKTPGEGTLYHGTTIASDKSHREWATYSTQFKFASEKSLIGRVARTGQPEWQSDVSEMPLSKFVRAPGARRCGVRGLAGLFHRTLEGLRTVICLFTSSKVDFTEERKTEILEVLKMWESGLLPSSSGRPIKLLTRSGSFESLPLEGSEFKGFERVEMGRWRTGNKASSGVSENQGFSNFMSQTHTLRESSKSKDKYYTCEYCAKVFYKKGNYQVHLRTHTKEKPFSCIDCGREFTQKSNMKRHRQKIHSVDPKSEANKKGNETAEISSRGQGSKAPGNKPDLQASQSSTSESRDMSGKRDENNYSGRQNKESPHGSSRVPRIQEPRKSCPDNAERRNGRTSTPNSKHTSHRVEKGTKRPLDRSALSPRAEGRRKISDPNSILEPSVLGLPDPLTSPLNPDQNQTPSLTTEQSGANHERSSCIGHVQGAGGQDFMSPVSFWWN
eukprot:CAMPEP_0114488990 /NCGR_PEP_ID=MMETSP0109-20121206/1637_1 /TAXON_ID=29199 /ORGANISM="Chlorarachnion reptans, Strain CCCM449" /LENGTH=527 /DNA_ID=CAMNT_0001665445 /DNA_START=138 /DNA_END=1721 /DNA_ORIENTATION=+